MVPLGAPAAVVDNLVPAGRRDNPHRRCVGDARSCRSPYLARCPTNGEIVVVDSDAAVGATRPALEIAAIAQVGKIAGDATQIRCYLPPRRPLAGRGGR